MKRIVLLFLLSACSTDDSQECSQVGEKITATGTQCAATVLRTQGEYTKEHCTQYQKYTDTYICGSDYRWYLDEREFQPFRRSTNE